MYISKILFTITAIFFFITSCTQEIETDSPAKSKDEIKSSEKKVKQEPHQYGGWYCPDNFGFQPVDITQLSTVPVVTDRLPTEEEARNGTSLMFIDTAKYPNARAFEMGLPKLARVYNPHSDMHEFAIIIQAVIINEDTVVGYRFANGGNGSAWYNEVELVSENELSKMESSPFVYMKKEFKSDKKEVWEAFTKSDYAIRLGEKFNQEEFFTLEYDEGNKARLDYSLGNDRASGIVTTLYGNFYLHIDYNYGGFHYSEKMLLIENSDTKTLELHFAAGPFPKNYSSKKKEWEEWMNGIENIVEAN